MGLYEARGNIQKALKDLTLKWHQAKQQWNDEQAELVQRETLEPLEKEVRAAGEAMDAMKQLVSAARRECEQ